MTKQVDFSVAESLKKLKKSLGDIAPSLEAQVNSAVKDLAYNAYAYVMAMAQHNLKSTREKYLDGLQFEDLGDSNFLISLDGKMANAIEDGWAPFDMTAKMLASNSTVSEGSRAGQPWVKTAKDGHKYAHVPIQKSVAGASQASNLADSIRGITAQNANNRKQKITSIFKDQAGNPLEGKVAVGRSDNPYLDGLTKYQKVTETEGGKKKVQSVYVAYRTTSENGKPWMHPGWKGLKSFEAAEAEIVKQIDQIIKTFT